MPHELKGKIAGVIADARNEDYDGCLTMDLDEAVDSVLSLIDAERCVWTYTDGGYETSCDSWLFQEQAIHPHCPDCGKRIEVKDGQ